MCVHTCASSVALTRCTSLGVLENLKDPSLSPLRKLPVNHNNNSSHAGARRYQTRLGIILRCAEWYKTPWDRIDVDFLSEETKKLQKDIKSLNKAVRNYEVYRLMEEKLKAMGTALPLIGDLAHPAMRDRHWEQLMRATGKTFVKDDKFSLGDLLNLGLHNYVDDCSEIVDRAQKVQNTPVLHSL